MKKEKRQLKILAKNYKIDSDELLVELWDDGDKFQYLKNENSIIKKKDKLRAQDIIKLKFNNSGVVERKKKPRFVQYVCAAHDFSEIGKTCEHLDYLSKDEVEAIYQELVIDFANDDDPISPSGIKDRGLFESAINHPQTSYAGIKKYPSVEASAAALMFALTHNHAFYNGNKRTSIVSMLTFLDRQNLMFIPDCDQDELFKVSIDLAKHKLVKNGDTCPDNEIFALAMWIQKKTIPIIKGEREVTLRKLKQILAGYNCEILENGKIRRQIQRKNFLGITRSSDICSTKSINNAISDGQEVNRTLIKKLRMELQLDDEHGVDSNAFYGPNFYYSTSDFINKYKIVLKRLSKL